MVRDLWNLTAHSVLLVTTAANMESKYLEIRGYFEVGDLVSYLRDKWQD